MIRWRMLTLRFLQYRRCARLRWPCSFAGPLPWGPALTGAPRHRPTGARACRTQDYETSRSRPWPRSHAPLEPRLLPDGAMLVTERVGTVRLVTPDGRVSDPLAGTPPVGRHQPGRYARHRLDPDCGKPPRLTWLIAEERGGGIGLSVRAGGADREAEAFATPQVISVQIRLLSGGVIFPVRGSSSIPTGRCSSPRRCRLPIRRIARSRPTISRDPCASIRRSSRARQSA